ncbi:MAG: exosortase system-associated protein, TIGR04073 family [Verrucomicrobia bacterium]|nr:exosortase system-associated protein, TIGR04073 family [Verrucomicrobiota bacterium]
MRISMMLVLGAAALVLSGCVNSRFSSAGIGGVENKLGRGLNNAMEIFRAGELRRSIEQTGLWDGPEHAFSTGLVRGMSRTMTRTAVGFGEMLTAPFPPYEPFVIPDKWLRDPSNKIRAEPFTMRPPYPDAYHPRVFSDSLFHTDSRVGFSGGEIIPIIPGSRFRVFEY